MSSRYISLLESQLEAPFVLDPALNPADYSITNSMRDLDNWKARVFLANNWSDGMPDKGEMGEVGYTMISTTTNHIIPISRSDEHNKGGDLLYWLRDRKKLAINPTDYVPLFNGNNYIYSMSEIPIMLNVMSKYLSYGAPDSIIQGAYGEVRKIAITAKQFVASGGDVVVRPGTVAPLGRALIEDYQECAKALAACRANGQRSLIGRAFQTALQVLRRMLSYRYSIMMHLELSKVSETMSQLGELRRAEDVQGLELLMFGHDSLKNTMHMSMKQYQAARDAGNPKLWDDKVEAFWGDLPLAIDMLARF
jgi:hypothetical protein